MLLRDQILQELLFSLNSEISDTSITYAELMEARLEQRFEEYLGAPNTWDPALGGKRGLIGFNDSLEESLPGQLSDRTIEAIIDRMLSGDYYPPDAVQFFGRFRDEGRHLKIGERILQRARMLPFLDRFYLYSMAEIFVAESGHRYCRIGYVTTKRHFGRGIWSATLHEKDGTMKLLVESEAYPGSWQFWVGLPVARYLQLRARRRGIENIRQLARDLESA